jgi:hypothetical protein
MKNNLLKATGCVGAVIVLALTYITGVRAQPSNTSPGSRAATTNWVGYLVVGQNDTTDAIAIGGPHPTVARHVEIGLRSDGTVVWRKATNGK